MHWELHQIIMECCVSCYMVIYYDKNGGWERWGVPRLEDVLPYVGDYPILFIFSLPLLLHVIQ